MSDDTDVSDVPITIKSETHDAHDGLKVTHKSTYVPPLDGSFDPFIATDTWIKMQVAQVLDRHYPGYDWFVDARASQGIVVFSIPDLMGETLKQVIRLVDHTDLPSKLIVNLAGNLLERMGLRRGPMIIAEYIVARNNRHKFDFGDVKQ